MVEVLVVECRHREGSGGLALVLLLDRGELGGGLQTGLVVEGGSEGGVIEMEGWG